MSVWGGPKRRVYGILGANLLLGVVLSAAGFPPRTWILGAAAFLAFCCMPITNACSQPIWQVKPAPDVQGRVFAARRMIAWASLPLAYLLAGPLADQVFEPLLAEGGPLAGSVGQIITPFRVPSIAVRDRSHYAKDLWRGSVWVNVNWLIARGLDRYGFGNLAAALRTQTMREIEEWFERYGVLFEFYDDRREVAPPRLMRKGQCAPEASPYHQVIHDYGWTATLYVDLVCSTREATAGSPDKKEVLP